MGTVFMYMNPFHLLRIYISRDVWAFVDHKHLFPFFHRFPGKYGAVQTGSYYNIIICFHFLFSCFLRFFRFHLADASSIIYKLCQNVIPFSFSALFVSLLQPCGFLNFCKIMNELRNRTYFAPLS